MILPKLHYISQGENPKKHLENIQNACSHGAELVQLRLKDLSPKKVLKAAEEAREITAHFQTRLIINDYYKIAKEVKADGVHLGKNDTCPTVAKKHLGEYYFVGGTANTLQDFEALLKKKVDYIGLGPFRFTKTKDNLSPIVGYNGYLTILEELKTDTPIIAIGGITLNDVPEIIETGIYGIAASGEITQDFNNIGHFHKALNTPSTQEEFWIPNQNG
ncbi:MAG: thiamine-phosphate pyrophosphorylase [Crocinitomicaceae bacterium]|jgi:thiamine-phosphate pyrophosphorylase